MKIKLKPLHEDDALAIAKLANNKKIWNNIRDAMPHPYEKEDADLFIGLKKEEDPICTFAIVSDDIICGVIGLEIQKDIYRKSAEMGYWIGEPYWGRGIASEAVRLILKYGFEELGIERIFAAAFDHNIGSMRVLLKNGFVKEGILRKAVYKNETYLDEHRFAKLKSD